MRVSHSKKGINLNLNPEVWGWNHKKNRKTTSSSGGWNNCSPTSNPTSNGDHQPTNLPFPNRSLRLLSHPQVNMWLTLDITCETNLAATRIARIDENSTYLYIFRYLCEKWTIVYIVYGKNTDEHLHPRFTQSTCSAKPMTPRQVTWRHCQLQLCFLPGLRVSNFPSSDMGSFWKIAEELNENHGIVRFVFFVLRRTQQASQG